MAEVKVTIKDLGWKKIRAALRRAAGSSAVAGIFEKSATRADGTDMIVVAASNEFGTDDIPRRSFLRAPFSKNQAKYIKMFGKSLKEATIDVEKALAATATAMRVDIRNAILSVTPPPNAVQTVKRKGHGRTLRDTDQLLSAIDSKVRKGR